MSTAVGGLLVGLLLLTLAADHFVIGAGRLAVRLRVSAVVIGAVIIGFGTSAPELVVSSLAAARGSLDIAVGNIVGSNIANLTLVLGSAAVVAPVAVASPTLRREGPIATVAVGVFAWLVQGGLTRAEGAWLAVGLPVALAAVLRGAREDPRLAAEAEEFLEPDRAHRLGVEVLRTVAGLVGVLLAAQLLVASAEQLADRLGLAEGFVGLTIVAVGTSLPELATSLQAARRGEADLLVGNLLGSNVFNSLAVGGAAALAGPGRLTDPALAGTATAIMVGVAVAAVVLMRTGHRVERWEGAVLLAAWIATLPLVARS